MQKKTRVLSAAMAGSLALAVAVITASSSTGPTARHASGRVMVRLSAVNTPGYDGTDPYQTGCANGAVVVGYSHLWSHYFGSSPGLRDGDSLVRLVYSPRCRTVWAVLTGTLYTPPEDSGGQAVVIRTSDYHSVICHADIDGNCYTAQLSDAGVTSYAVGNDTLGAGGAVYYGRTRNY